MLAAVIILLFLISTYNNVVLPLRIRPEQITLFILLLIAVSSLSSSITIIALFASVEVQSLILYLIFSSKITHNNSVLVEDKKGNSKPSLSYLFNASCATALLLYSISINSSLLLLISIMWKLGAMPMHA